MSNTRAGLLVVCRADGTVIEILRDDLGVATVGGNLQSIFAPRFGKRAQEMFARLAAGESVYARKLSLANGQPLYFAGAVGPDMLIAASSSKSYLGSFCAALLAHVSREAARERLELELNETKLRGIFESMEDGYFEATLDGPTTLVNPAAVRMLGFDSVEELMAFPARQLYADQDERMRLRSILDKQGTVSSDRVRLRRKDGSIGWFEGTVRLLPNPDGPRPRLVRVFRSLDERMLLEQEAQARRAAEEANRLKSEFLANMSHEIRTPMNAVLGLTHLALQTELTLQQQDYLKKIQRSGRALLHIVNDILDYSKVEAGKLELERVHFDVFEAVNSVVSTLRPQATEKWLELRVSFAPGVRRHLLGDPLRLNQVLLNLISNAVKFTERGAVSVRVEAIGASDAAEKVRLRFQVRDTGLGIEPELTQALFRPFTQADSSITRKFGGTGLGLAICKRLVLLMGGDIAVESLVGRGSIFTFTAVFEPGAPQDEAVATAAKGLDRVAGKRVLLVEDNAINQQIASELLKRAGLTVDLAENGQIAVDRVLGAAQSWDLILMDLQMPVMDGYTATGLIRRDPRFAHLPIVAMTAHVLPEERNMCYLAGMNDFLSKPIEPEVLFDAVRRWVDTQGAAREAASIYPSLDGVDTVGGLRRVGGNPTLYRSLLLEMADGCAAACSDLRDASQSGDARRVRQLAHSLRGVAGNLGLLAVAEHATVLEASGEHVEELIDALQATCREIQARA